MSVAYLNPTGSSLISFTPSKGLRSAGGNVHSIPYLHKIRHGFGAGRCTGVIRRGTAADNEPQPTTSSPPPPISASWQWHDSNDALLAYSALVGILLFGSIPASSTFTPFQYLYFTSLAGVTIYIGSHKGLNKQLQRQINLKDGLIAPFLFSASLFSIYLLLKFFPGINVKVFFNGYFWLIGSLSLIQNLIGPGRRLNTNLFHFPVWNVTLPASLVVTDENTGESSAKTSIHLTDVVVVAMSVGIASLDLSLNHQNHSINNLLACAIAVDVLQLLGLSSFRAAALFLVGLAVYDVVWVFASPALAGENVMLKVATSDVMSGPTKLLFPRFPGSASEATDYPFSLLGLGDVVIPGLLAALSLKFDASRAVNMKARGIAAAEAIQAAIDSLDDDATGQEIADAAADAAEIAFDKVADGESNGGEDEMASHRNAASESVLVQRTYFLPALLAYGVGLGITFYANKVMSMAQPALLYLIPSMLVIIGGVAVIRGEVDRVWTFTDVSRSLPGSKQD
jgi:minor histocompatibility antigen H13